VRRFCQDPLAEAVDAIAELFARDNRELRVLLSRTEFRYHCANEREFDPPGDLPRPISPWWRRWFRE